MKPKRLIAFILALQISGGNATAASASLSPERARTLNQTITSQAEGFRFYYGKMRSRLSSQVLRDRTKTVLKDIRSGTALTVKTVGGGLARAVPHQGQTLLIIWIASMIMAVEQEYDRQQLIGKSRSQKELEETFLELTNRSINSFEIFSGLAGGAVFGTTFSVPLQYLNAIIANKVSRPILARLLSTGAASLVTFLGWELARHLWKEAIFLLDTPEEVKVGEKLLFTSVMTGTASAEDKRIFDKIIQNAWVILAFGDPEMTESWIYNTWRLTLMTGEFISLVTAMSAAAVSTSAAVGAVAPGAGHVVTFVSVLFGGVMGAYVAHHLPKEVKQPITKFLRGGRHNVGTSRMHVNLQELRRILSYYEPHRAKPYNADYHAEEFSGYLGRRAEFRNHVMTIHFENIFLHYMNTLMLRQPLNDLEIARGSDSEKYKEYLATTAPALAQEELALRKLADRVIEFYQAEVQDLERIIEKRPAATPDKILKSLDAHLERVVWQLQFNLSILSLFSPSILKAENMAVMAPHPSVFEEYLNGFYFFGYRESAVYELLVTAEANHETKK